MKPSEPVSVISLCNKNVIISIFFKKIDMHCRMMYNIYENISKRKIENYHTRITGQDQGLPLRVRGGAGLPNLGSRR